MLGLKPIAWKIPAAWAGVLCALWWAAVSPAAAHAAGAVKIGALLPLSGDNAVTGRAAKRGIQLAVEERREAFEKKELDLEVLYADSRMNPETGERAAAKLIREEGVVALIGPFSSPVVLEVAPLANREQVVMISGSATSTPIRDAGDFIFRTVSPDNYQGRAIARFGYELLRARRAAILFVNNEYGADFSGFVRREFTDLGGSIVYQRAFEPDTENFQTILRQLQEAQPHCVFVASYPTQASHIFNQAAGMGMDIPMLGGDGLYSSKFLELVRDTSMGVYATASTWRPNSRQFSSTVFVKKYEEKYNRSPNVYAAYYFDAATLVLDALLAGARSSEDIQSFLMQNMFVGATGKIRFDRNGEVAKPVDIFKAENKNYEYFFTIQPRSR